MKQLIKDNETGKINLEEVPIPKLGKNYVLVRNIFSAVSVGTETSAIQIAKKNIFQKAKERPKEFKKVLSLMNKEGFWAGYRIAVDKLGLPSTLGYSSVGQVLEVGQEVSSISVGDTVACGGSGHAEIVAVPKNLCCKIDEGVNLKEAAFTTIGAIAMQGLRQANTKLGEVVAVIGLGLIGQITMELLRASGCKAIGIDIDKSKVIFSKKIGKTAYSRNDSHLFEKIDAITKSRGVDSVIIAASTPSEDPIKLASEIIRQKGTITVVGAVKLKFERKHFYEKELTLNLSKSYGPGRYDYKYEHKGIDYPVGYVRFTEKRNMEAFVQLISDGQLNIENLITSTHEFSKSKSVYQNLLSSDKSLDIGILFDYNSRDINQSARIDFAKNPNISNDKISVGVIGAGSYCQRYILPSLKKNNKINLLGVCTSTGINANHISKFYNFSYSTTDASQIIKDKDIGLIIIATRHDSHGQYVIQGLEAGKYVYCEKPLTIQEKDLVEIREMSLSNPNLVVGYNRRFSSLSIKANRIFKERDTPLIINYTINSSKLNADHWVYDNEEGGGRILGEMCHFIDFCSYIIGRDCESVYSKNLAYRDDNFSTLRYSDGSIANITYTTEGDTAKGKEIIRIIGGGKTVKIIDFKELYFFTNGKLRYHKNLRRMDKGREQLFNLISDFDKFKSTNIISIESILNTSLSTFRIKESMEKDAVLKVN